MAPKPEVLAIAGRPYPNSNTGLLLAIAAGGSWLAALLDVIYAGDLLFPRTGGWTITKGPVTKSFPRWTEADMIY